MPLYWSVHGHLQHFVWVVFKCVCLMFSPVTLRVSVLFWLWPFQAPSVIFGFSSLLPHSLPCSFSPFSPSYRTPWGTAESLERVRLSLVPFLLSSAGHELLKYQSQLELSDIANIHHIFLIIWLVFSFNQHLKSLQ